MEIKGDNIILVEKWPSIAIYAQESPINTIFRIFSKGQFLSCFTKIYYKIL